MGLCCISCTGIRSIGGKKRKDGANKVYYLFVNCVVVYLTGLVRLSSKFDETERPALQCTCCFLDLIAMYLGSSYSI